MPYSNQIYMKNWKKSRFLPQSKLQFVFRLRLQKQSQTIYQRKISVLINTNIEKKMDDIRVTEVSC